MAEYQLKSYEFRKEREATWRELESLVERVESGGLRRLRPDEVARLPEVYRATLSSLSVARAISLDRNLVAYLEALSRRAYVAVYSARRPLRHTITTFFRNRFPALAWEMRWNLLVSIAVLLAGVTCGLVLTLQDPDRYYGFSLSDGDDERGPLSTREELLEILESKTGNLDSLSAFGSFLFAHNTRIGLACFTLGFAAGAPVILLLFVNGLSLGAFIAIHRAHGIELEVLAWLLPHGVTELLAVCVCGAAGLAVGRSLVFPGKYRRVDALAHEGRRAGALVVGTVAMFLAAALLEGFFRQIVTHTGVRLTLATTTAVFWIWYFGPYGRGQAR